MMNRPLVPAVVLIGVACIALPARADFQIRSTSVAGRSYLFLRDIATYYGMSYRGLASQAELRSRWSRLRFEPDQRRSTINGVTVHLCFAPAEWKGEVLLARTDFQELLDPILRTRELPRHRVRRVLLDPGHGGRDQGAAGKLYTEKEITLQIARRAAAHLTRRGYEVRLTRTGDENLPLRQRCSQVHQLQPDLLISIHCNASGSASVSGVETFLVTPCGTPSTYSSETTSTRCEGNRFDRLNARLAYEIQRALIRGTSSTDRGVKHARFLILREAPCPAVLVETGFLSNASEERRLGTLDYQERLASGLCNGIVRVHQSLEQR